MYQPYADKGWTNSLLSDGTATIFPVSELRYNPAVDALTLSLTLDIAFAVVALLPTDPTVECTIRSEDVVQPEGIVPRLYPGVEGSAAAPVGEAYSTLLAHLSNAARGSKRC